MAEPEEECELQQLVPLEEDHRLGEQYGQVTPPVSPGISKITQTSPTSPVSNKVSSSSPVGGTSSLRGAASQASSSTRSLSRIATAPTIGSNTTSNTGSGTRLLYINEKLSLRQPRTSQASLTSRPHSIKRDVTDVRRMETALLHLLEDFHSGKLRAFGKDCSMEQMTGIREQQERLARLHFELGAQQELFPPLSDEGLRQGAENMTALMTSLEQLSESIEKLHSFNS
ncbi:uncharacterized protein LOC142327389 isoform X2 [Lycorma delicatula]|uniref:uncharacterized protein LOC142327389 isoform X2 n=1 Tax=Lycorma delicatula TaxID=130591 RepID=UPI003F50DF8F